MTCGAMEASCLCVNEYEECDGTHVCDCGGSWITDENGETIGYAAFPGGFYDPAQSLIFSLMNPGLYSREDF